MPKSVLAIGNRTFLPTKQKRFNKYKDKLNPWITKGIMSSIKFRDNLYRKLKCAAENSNQYLSLKTNLKNYNTILQKMIRKAKHSYHHDLFAKFQNDSKKTWLHINSILGRKKCSKELADFFVIKNVPTYDKLKIANKFNSFFTEVGPSFSSKIPQPDGLNYKQYLKGTISSRFNFELVKNDEILKIIKKLKPKTSCGYDDISSKLLKMISPSICPILTVIINQSLTTGIFPEKLKIAKVIPLYKKGNEHLFDNYRPISLLPCVSKVIEKVVFKQIYAYFVDHKLIYDSQYGFRQLHSTELASLELIDRITQNLDNRKLSISIFLDLSKDFDTLDHDILLQKLHYYGITGTANSWFQSYLCNRQQFVLYENTKSTMMPISTGVPQGSILGPLLFLIYMNDIHEASKKFSAILYADDTSLVEPLCTFDISAKSSKFNKTKLSENINNELQAIYDWLCVNKLSLNIPKTKFMLFHHKQSNINSFIPDLSINGNTIDRVSHFNFLGFVIDENLSYDQHIQGISNKISRSLGILNKLKRFLPQYVLLMLYNSLILPQLQYAILCWGFKSSRLFKLQKRAVRIITCSNYNDHTEPLFKQLNLLKLAHLYDVSKLKFYHKLKYDKLPVYFMENISTSKVHHHHTRSRNKPQHTSTRTDHAEHSIRNHLPIFLSSLPNLITDKVQTHSLHGFSVYCKKYFIDKYENSCKIMNCYICNKKNNEPILLKSE